MEGSSFFLYLKGEFLMKEKTKDRILMNEKTKDYFLTQYQSIAVLQELLVQLYSEWDDYPEEYRRMYVRGQKDYRNDWLFINGLSMSKEEKALWDEIEENIA